MIDADGKRCPMGTPGQLAVRGPIGCRYLANDRQVAYVQSGWNVTGDTYVEDADGYFWFKARNDDMIVSSGYNIAGPEVEASLLAHPAVAEAGRRCPGLGSRLYRESLCAAGGRPSRGCGLGQGAAGPCETGPRTL
ncbi:hypothetical protein [Aurantimonas marina]